MPSQRVTLTTSLDRGDRTVRITARCTCGSSVDGTLDAPARLGDDPARWRDADAHATTLRAAARALEAEGCVHAWHDARMVTPCLLRPSRPRRDEALAAVADLDVAQGPEAWETLAARGWIPMEWVGDDARRFVTSFGTHDVAPSTRDEAAALAADVDGVRRAEDLARELLSRMRPFGLAQPPRVAWRVVDPSFWSPRRGWYLTPALPRTFGDAVGVVPSGGASPPWWDLARFDVAWADGWHRIADAPPNAVEPLAALWMLGYALDAVTDDAVVLAAPTA